MTAIIEAHGLTKRYGKTRALDGLDLVAEPGQVVAVLGPNGAGKTTFVRTVATLLRPDAGTLRVAGHDVRREPGRVRASIGLAGQFAAVEPAMTGRENLEMVARLFGQSRRDGTGQRRAPCSSSSGSPTPPTGSRAPTRAACAAASTSARASSARRACCCSTSRPPGLDPRSRIELWDAIRALVEAGTDVLLTTQYLDEADHLAEPDRDHRPRPRGRRRARPAELKRRVGGNVIEVHARSRAHLATVAERAQPALAGASADRRGHPTRHDRRRPPRATASPRPLRSIEAPGVQIDDIALRQPTLDEVFLALTGQPMTEQHPGRAPEGVAA